MSVTGTATADPAADSGLPRPVPPPGLPWWLGLPVAALAGVAMLVAFPPVGWWPLAPVGVALLALAVRGRGIPAGAGLGLLAGAVFFAPLLTWTNLHVGKLPWLLLSGSQAAFLALLGAACAFATPLYARFPWLWPPLVGALWVAQEAARDRAPFGGFPWGRLAFSQEDGPLLRLAALGGAPLVTFAVGLVGGLLALAVWLSVPRYRVRPGTPAPGRWRPGGGATAPVLLAAGGAGAVLLGGLLVPLPAPGVGDARPGGSGGAPVVAVVQGNVPRLGFDFNAQRRAVLDNHVNATLALAGQVSAGRRPQPDLVVWPENASDIDPTRNEDAAERIREATTAIGAPILVGTLLEGPGDGIRNATLLWDGAAAPQVAYVKRHPVPFAEYIPLRRIARVVSDKVDLVVRDYQPGSRPGVVRAGRVTVGTVICFEVAYDDLVRDSVGDGVQVLAVQTNNATFNVAEARQQMAMVRLRAVEHGRPGLMASTVGVSGFVDTHGGVHQATGFNVGAVIVARLDAPRERTVATTLGPVPEVVLAGLGVAGLVWAGVRRRRAARRPARAERGS